MYLLLVQLDSLAIPCMELFGQDGLARLFAPAEPETMDASAGGTAGGSVSRPASSTPPVFTPLQPSPAACVATPLGIVVLWEVSSD